MIDQVQLADLARLQGEVTQGVRQDEADLDAIAAKVLMPAVQGMQADNDALAGMRDRILMPVLKGVNGDAKALAKVGNKLIGTIANGVMEDQAQLTSMYARSAPAPFSGGARIQQLPSQPTSPVSMVSALPSAPSGPTGAPTIAAGLPTPSPTPVAPINGVGKTLRYVWGFYNADSYCGLGGWMYVYGDAPENIDPAHTLGGPYDLTRGDENAAYFAFLGGLAQAGNNATPPFPPLPFDLGDMTRVCFLPAVPPPPIGSPTGPQCPPGTIDQYPGDVQLGGKYCIPTVTVQPTLPPEPPPPPPPPPPPSDPCACLMKGFEYLAKSLCECLGKLSTRHLKAALPEDNKAVSHTPQWEEPPTWKPDVDQEELPEVRLAEAIADVAKWQLRPFGHEAGGAIGGGTVGIGLPSDAPRSSADPFAQGPPVGGAETGGFNPALFGD